MASATFELFNDAKVARGSLVISTLPKAEEAHGQQALQDLSGTDTHGLEPVQLLEGVEYLFQIEAHAAVRIDKSELFIADDKSGRRGRLRTKLYTGRVEVRIEVGDEVMRPIAFEVRSSKLSYREDYRWMLESIAELSANLVLERFAPSAQRVAVDVSRDADSIYQQFVFLRGLLESERLSSALRRVIAEPYIQWERIEHVVPPNRGMRPGSAFIRQLLRPGPRQDWTTSPHPLLTSIPRELTTHRTEETLDNVPNRFVLFALEEWLSLTTGLLEILKTFDADSSAAVQRGLREGETLAEHLQDLIRSPIFHDVGALTEFPVANQVLQKKEGYREVLNAYLLVQLGSTIAWEGGDDVFSAGQRNVATLYEYWVFLELAKIVSDLCSKPMDLTSLISESGDGLNLVLKRKKAHRISGTIGRFGREFIVELHFNQQFAPGPNGTWTRSLRPDCSLHVVPTLNALDDDDVWLHFDAKYRVVRIEDVLGDDDDDVELVAKKDDIYKMHTYRDAIVRAVGAYVVFPGTEVLTREQYTEILPGLGAFPLRPSSSGLASGSSEIRHFLDAAIDHIATQTTRHERARYWRRESMAGPDSAVVQDAAAFLQRPPADTQVLLGYAKSSEHHEWIARNLLYNLRADKERAGAVGLRGPELAVEYLVLYGQLADSPALFSVEGEPQVFSSSELAALEYPGARGQLYFCLRLKPVRPPRWLSSQLVELVANRVRSSRVVGHPLVVSWTMLTATS